MNGLAANLRLYRIHQVAAGALVWMPVLFLHLIERHGLGAALRLQAVYYIAVVLSEVPTGRFSDRFGRVVTMRLVALAWFAAMVAFAAGDTVIWAAVGQVLLAIGIAGMSGTDVSFHLDTLEALGRGDEFAPAEAVARRGMLIATAVAAAASGVLWTVDSRLPFVAAGVAAAVQGLVALRLVEPSAAVGDATRTSLRAATAALGRGGRRTLAWLGTAMVVHVVTVHLVAELAVPFQLDVFASDTPGLAAVSNGVLVAAVSSLGALGVAPLVALARRVGLRVALASVTSISVTLLAAMAWLSTAWLVPILVLRGVQGPVVTVLVAGSVGALVGAEHRATALSFMGLAGRLVLGATLLGLSGVTEGGGTGLTAALIVALALVSVLAAGSPIVPAEHRRLDHDHRHHHDRLDHDHLHDHNDGHHDHEHEVRPDGPHRHPHHHEALTHAHPHTSDLHHRHSH